MPSNRPRIATYTSDEKRNKFKVISAIHKMSMSEYMEYLINREIEQYEKEHGTIIIHKGDK